MKRKSKTAMKPEDYYFVVDSDRLDRVNSGLYGYCITERGIFFSGDGVSPQEIPYDGLGSYCLILREKDKIVILQDTIGSQGIYLYQDGDYFALSNSDLYLMEYLKSGGNHPFTVNEDYACHYISEELAVYSCSETIINEIRLLARDVKVMIDISKRTLKQVSVDLCEDTIPIDTPEGMAALDAWMEKWSGIVRSLYASGENIEFDLSGGFDSRMSILVGLNAGINMGDVMVRSLNDGLYTHDEDYRIASEIAERYRFALNQDSVFTYQDMPFRLPEILAISMYAKGFSHKQMYYKMTRHDRPKYRVTGAGGENRRHDKDNRQPADIMRSCQEKTKKYISGSAQEKAQKAEERVLERTGAEVREALEGRADAADEISRRMLMDSWWRFHFGKDMYECYPANEIKLLPLLDPELMKLTRTGEKGDQDLLIAVILVRYGKEMLDIPFEGGRSISQETIDYAGELCDRYPWEKPERQLLKREEKPEEISPMKQEYTEKQAFHTARLLAADPCIRACFCSVIDEETYLLLTKDSFKRKFRPLQMLNGIIAVGVAGLYAAESKGGNSRTFMDLVRESETGGFMELAEEIIRSEENTIRDLQNKLIESEAASRKKERMIDSLKKDMEKIRGSKTYKAANTMAGIYRKVTLRDK